MPSRTIHFFFTVRFASSFQFVSKTYRLHSDSGHGGQVSDKNGDEIDKNDESLSITSFSLIGQSADNPSLEDILCYDSSIIIDDVSTNINHHPRAR